MADGAAAVSGIPLDQLLTRLAACYDSAAGRNTKNGDCSQQDVLLLLSDSCFFPACQQVVKEIQTLERTQKSSTGASPEKQQRQSAKETAEGGASAEASLLNFVHSRGYPSIPPTLDAETVLQDFSLRRLILFNLLVDLQTVRLECKTRLVQDLLPGAGGAGTAPAAATAAAAGDEETRAAALLEALQAVSAAAGLPPSTPASLAKKDALSALSLAYDFASRIGSEQLQRAAASRMLLPVPVPGKTPQEQQQLLQHLQQLTTALDAHYRLRRQALMRRHDVTVQAFLWSRRAEKYEEEIAAVLQKAAAWKQSVISGPPVGLYDVFAAEKDVLLSCCRPRAPKREAVSFKTLMVGPVPGRGGVPEGYSARAFIDDVRKANASMKAKDKSSGAGNFRGGSSSSSSAYAQSSSGSIAYAQSSSSSSNSFVEGTPGSAYNGSGFEPSRGHSSRNYRGRGSGQQPQASRRPGTAVVAAGAGPGAGVWEGGSSNLPSVRPASFAGSSSAAVSAALPPTRFHTVDRHQEQQQFQQPSQQYPQQQPPQRRNFAVNRGRGGGAPRGRGGASGRGGAAAGGFGGRASDRPVTWNPAG